MKGALASAAVVAIVVGLGRSPNPTAACEHCGCASRPPTHAGTVHIDADYAGDTVSGTGIVLTSSGRVLTNDHVIRGTTGICVTTADRSYPATVIGMDPGNDLAVVQLQGASGLTTASLGDSSTVEVGDRVTMLGNDEDPDSEHGRVRALGRRAAVTDAIRGRTGHLTDLIEVGAEMPAGNSGGPLLNADHQVIGVNVAGTRRTGLAIPINKATAYVKSLGESRIKPHQARAAIDVIKRGVAA